MRGAKCYLANELGFSETGRYVLDTLVKPRITEIGIYIYDPFIECAKELDLEELKELQGYGNRVRHMKEFNEKVTPINNRLMKDSDCLLAILDGGHAVDDGVASEIGYYAGIERGPVIALRSDFRSGENIATSINPQLLGYILQKGGILVDGEKAMEKWFKEIRKWYESFIQG